MKHERRSGRKTPPRLHVVLVEPQIPPNTGNVARLTAGTGCRLHLVEPLGFSIDDKQVRRAGLDYWPHVDLHVHPSWDAFVDVTAVTPERLWLFSARTGRSYLEAGFREGDYLVFGREADGLSPALRDRYPGRCVNIGMDRTVVRSLNLSNAVAVAVYEAIRVMSLE